MGLTNPTVGGLWGKVYEETLGVVKDNVVIEGIDGDIDKEYLIHCRFVNALASSVSFYLTINNDTGANYGYQNLTAADTTVSAAQSTTETKIRLGGTSDIARLSQYEGILHAESGQVRTLIGEIVEDVATTFVIRVTLIGWVWSNTASVISSLKIFGGTANALGIGTFIGVYKKLPG